ncbi:hypothetical protein K7432_004312 [Basidiobolus ranarum]
MLRNPNLGKEEKPSDRESPLALRRSASLDNRKELTDDLLVSKNSKYKDTPLRRSRSFADTFDQPHIMLDPTPCEVTTNQKPMPKKSLRRKKGLVLNKRISSSIRRDNVRNENHVIDWKSLADSYDDYHSDSESSKGSIKSAKIRSDTTESNNRATLTPRRSRSFNVTTQRSNKSHTSLSRTLSTREQNRIHTEKIGIWSKRFFADREPSAERISGILKSWTTNSTSSVYLSSVEMETEAESDDESATKSPKNFIRKMRHLKPRVSKILVRYPRSKTMSCAEESGEPSAIQTVDNEGLFPPGKEIKINRVQLNIRTSMEMRLTKEKLCKVVVEGVNQSITEKDPETPSNSVIPEIDRYPQLTTDLSMELCEEPENMPSLSTSTIVDGSLPNAPSQSNLSPVDQEEYSQSPLSLSDVGPSFFLTAFSDRLNLPLVNENSVELTQNTNAFNTLSSKEKSSVETFASVETESDFSPSSHLGLNSLESIPPTSEIYIPDNNACVTSPALGIEVTNKMDSKLEIKNLTLDSSNRKFIQRGFLGNLRVDSNIRITTSATLKAHTNSNKIIPIKSATFAKNNVFKSSRTQYDSDQLLEKQGKSKSSGEKRDVCKTFSNFPILNSVTPLANEPSISRKITLHGFTYQIVNSNAVKHRYLFLFDDLLVVTKPISKEENRHLGLHSRFLVKHCIRTNSIHFNGTRERVVKKNENKSKKIEGEPHPIFTNAVRKFESNPQTGLMYMIDKATLKSDPNSIAGFLHKTPELSKKQLGRFLGMECNHAVLNAFLDKCKLSGLRIDDALRVFLASFRLPGEGAIIDYLVSTFAKRWHKANRNRIDFDVDTSVKLSFFMMALNADLHNKKRSLRGKLELQEFLTRFQDSNSALVNIAEDLLTEIYTSIRKDKLETAVDEAASTLSISVTYPDTQHLGVNESIEIVVEIPAPDKNFRIKPIGDGLTCEPKVLNFIQSNQQTLKISFNSAGRKSLTLIKLGSRGRKYSNIPGRVFMMEPNYMKHSILLTFPAEKTDKKFLFGFANRTTRDRWSEGFSGIKPSGDRSLRKQPTSRNEYVEELSTWTGYDLVEYLTKCPKH